MTRSGSAKEATVRDETKQVYARYYGAKGGDRNDLLTNRGVLFQTLAFDKANIRALSGLDLDRDSDKVLDVGCGSGSSLLSFIRLGFHPPNLTGIDIDPDRIEAARSRFPNINFHCGDATAMDFEDRSFDVVFESTMFLQMTDDELAAAIAREMLRVTKGGKYVVLVDWRYGKPGNAEYRALSRARIKRLFDVGGQTKIVGFERGALIPPVGRFLSVSAAGLYFAVQALFPPLVGQVTTVLEKVSDQP